MRPRLREHTHCTWPQSLEVALGVHLERVGASRMLNWTSAIPDLSGWLASVALHLPLASYAA